MDGGLERLRPGPWSNLSRTRHRTTGLPGNHLHDSHRSCGCAMTSASVRVPRPTVQCAGTTRTTSFGSNASLTHRPPHSHTHPNHRPRLPIARAHTAAAYTTTQTIAPRTLFVPLADEPALQELLNITHHAPLLLTPCSGHQSHRYQSPLHSLTPAATSITESAIAQCVGFATPALGVASGPTGKGTAPAPVDQQQLVTPLRPLILERELCTHPDNGFVRQLHTRLQHWLQRPTIPTHCTPPPICTPAPRHYLTGHS